MNNEEILKTLDQVFRKVLKRDNITLTETTTAADVEGWDSLTNMLLISEIEKTFQLHFSFREIVRLKNVGDLCAAIARKTE
ncbi:MAG: acyl carrier protein [Prevotella sp.]|nr:acyl carrier protein [Prevotella sp.]